MIPHMNIIAWSNEAPWASLRQVEQDLIISRAVIEIFNDDYLREELRFRGGTALNKLHFPETLRYSEDIDLVQMQPEPIGATIDAIRDVLSWLGKCNRTQSGHSMHLIFRFAPEVAPETTLKLKVEINTREHSGECTPLAHCELFI